MKKRVSESLKRILPVDDSPCHAYVVDGVHVRIRRDANESGEYLGLARREPFTLPGVNPFLEPDPLWFQFGRDRAALVDSLVAEVNAIPTLDEEVTGC